MTLRVVLATRIFPVALGFLAAVRDVGHEPVALLTVRDLEGRYLGGQLHELPPELDVLVPARRTSLAPLLRAVEPDLVVCMGFPWKVPPDALAVPSLGWLNGHPSLLPRHRGPTPLAWAIRAGEEESGITFHRMDEGLDTGPILAQRPFRLDDVDDPEALYARMGPVTVEALVEALQRLEAGEPGTPQAEGGGYETFFGEQDVHLDPTRPALEMCRLARAWRYTFAHGTEAGLLADVDGETVRVVRAALEELPGARRVDCADGPLWVVTEPVARPSA